MDGPFVTFRSTSMAQRAISQPKSKCKPLRMVRRRGRAIGLLDLAANVRFCLLDTPPMVQRSRLGPRRCALVVATGLHNIGGHAVHLHGHSAAAFSDPLHGYGCSQ